MRHIVLGHHNQPAGIFVQPMHDPGAQLAAHFAELVEAEQQRIHQGAAIALVLGAARTGMNHHARRLVDHRQILILVNHGQRNVLGKSLQRSRFNRPRDFDLFAALQLERCLGRAVVHQHLTLLHQ